MRKIYTLFTAFLLVSIVSAQPCPDSLYITTQAQIDSFQILYPNCTEIEWDVVIDGDDITNLNGLSMLTSVGRDLWFWMNDALTSLSGLDNVTSVGGDLFIWNNAALTSLTGLDNVTSVGGDLGILNTVALTSLTGLDNVTSVGGGLFIYNNAALTSLTGLENVTSVGGDLYITDNAALTSLAGLDNVTSVGGDLSINRNDVLSSIAGLYTVTSVGGYLAIEENAALTSLTGLDNVTYVGGDLIILNNAALTSLTGLDNVTSVGRRLWIEGNAALTSLTGLENINAESIEDLYIYGNQLLSSCAILSICNYLKNPNGTIQIEGNTAGCDSPEEVQDSCEAHAGIIDVSFIVDKLLIYPNPSSTQITIETPTTPPQNTLMVIYNLSGQQLISRQIMEQQTVIDVTGLPKGVYFVKVMNDDQVTVQKVIKQ